MNQKRGYYISWVFLQKTKKPISTLKEHLRPRYLNLNNTILYHGLVKMFQQMPMTNSQIKLNIQAIGISIPKLHFHSFWTKAKTKKEAKKELI